MLTKILAFFPPAMLQANRTISNEEIDPKYKNLVTLYRDVKFSLMTKNQAEYYFNKALETCSTMEAKLASQAPKGHLKQNLLKNICITLYYLTAGMSIFVLAAEFTFKFGFLPKNIFFQGFLMLYICCVTFFGLFSLHVSNYNLMQKGLTQPESLLNSSKMLTSLVTPISFNYLNIC